MNTTTPDLLRIGQRTFQSRLLTGTGKFRDFEETRLATEAAGVEIVTVAIRRTNIGQNADEPNLLDVLPPDRYTLLPNTAGCYSAEDAVRTCRLARELLDGHNLVKLEVLGDQKTCSRMCCKLCALRRPWWPMVSRSWSIPATTRLSRVSWSRSAVWR